MKHLVIGHGEVGTALAELLGCDWADVDTSNMSGGPYDVVHIAFPYRTLFAQSVRFYRRVYSPAHVVVHSTVPVGTCATLDAVHSPVRGVHPHLLDGLRVFVKYFGGPSAEAIAAEWPGPSRVLPNARTCEALKLWETAQYGVHIRLMQEIHAYCAANGLAFDDVYTYANHSYNHGYAVLGRRDVRRPVLKFTGPDIGGHCVKQNAELLDSPAALIVKNGF